MIRRKPEDRTNKIVTRYIDINLWEDYIESRMGPILPSIINKVW